MFSCCFKVIIQPLLHFVLQAFICYFELRSEVRIFIKTFFFFFLIFLLFLFSNIFFFMYLARFFLPLGPGNWETTLVATVIDQVSGWWSSTSLKHEGWGKCGKNPALSAVAMKIIVALSLGNTGSSTGHWWIMAAIWPPLQQLTTCQSDRHYSNSQPINLTAITATHNLSIWPPLQQLTTYQSDRHYSNSQPINLTAITRTHSLSRKPCDKSMSHSYR